jgi:hypothetical protein
MSISPTHQESMQCINFCLILLCAFVVLGQQLQRWRAQREASIPKRLAKLDTELINAKNLSAVKESLRKTINPSDLDTIWLGFTEIALNLLLVLVLTCEATGVLLVLTCEVFGVILPHDCLPVVRGIILLAFVGNTIHVLFKNHRRSGKINAVLKWAVYTWAAASLPVPNGEDVARLPDHVRYVGHLIATLPAHVYAAAKYLAGDSGYSQCEDQQVVLTLHPAATTNRQTLVDGVALRINSSIIQILWSWVVS